MTECLQDGPGVSYQDNASQVRLTTPAYLVNESSILDKNRVLSVTLNRIRILGSLLDMMLVAKGSPVYRDPSCRYSAASRLKWIGVGLTCGPFSEASYLHCRTRKLSRADDSLLELILVL